MAENSRVWSPKRKKSTQEETCTARKVVMLDILKTTSTIQQAYMTPFWCGGDLLSIYHETYNNNNMMFVIGDFLEKQIKG